MNNNIEKTLSDYIDSLNSEKKPREHGLADNSAEMEKLMETVRQVRSLREPALPQENYVKKLAEKVSSDLKSKPSDSPDKKASASQSCANAKSIKISGSENHMRKTRSPSALKARIAGVGIAAAVVVVALLMINVMYPMLNGNIVHAMEEAYEKVAAYHGMLEISETNAQGDTLNHTKLEIWADKNGHYV